MKKAGMQGLLRPMLVVICLSVLLAYVYQQSKILDMTAVQQAQGLITLLEFNESKLERDMLKVHNGEISHFDSLKYSRRHIMQLIEQLDVLLPIKIEALVIETEYACAGFCY